METKHCPSCKQDVAISGFTRNKARHDGLSGYCRPCQTAQTVASAARIRRRAMDALGGVCCRCGFEDDRALQFDHIDGGGSVHRKTATVQTVWREVIKGSTRYQLLCANCNWIKRAENGEHVGNSARIYDRTPPTERIKKERDWSGHGDLMREKFKDADWAAKRNAAVSAGRLKANALRREGVT